ncbi:MAG: hypothetical protein ACOCWM_02025 [Cyclobacteriaceae bacterium]
MTRLITLKSIILLTSIANTIGANGQLVTSLGTLLHALEQNYQVINEAELEEYKQLNKYKWLNYMPSVGYDLVYNRPVVSINLADIGRFINDNQAREHKQTSIIKSNRILLAKEKKSVTTRYNYLVNLFHRYDLEIEVYNLHYKLFILSKSKYENDEIPIEQFTQEQIKIKEEEKNLYTLKDRIYQSVIELEQITNYALDYEIKNFNITGSSLTLK